MGGPPEAEALISDYIIVSRLAEWAGYISLVEFSTGSTCTVTNERRCEGRGVEVKETNAGGNKKIELFVLR